VYSYFTTPVKENGDAEGELPGKEMDIDAYI
jgi:hypothetical protein